MNVTIMDMSTLTFESAMRHRNELYSIVIEDDKPTLKPLSLDSGIGAVLLKITTDEKKTTNDISEEKKPEEVESVPQVDKKRDKPHRTWEKLTYKFDGYSDNGQIKVESRPDGSIRISFKEKADAQTYRDYFRERFYASNNGADAISVKSIYDDLHLVNEDGMPKYDVIECGRWGYLSLDGGTCKYISEVSKTIGLDMYGFTIKRPIKLYGITAENAKR
jgi:hypothetical protein